MNKFQSPSTVAGAPNPPLAPETVFARALSANVAETITLPNGCNFVAMKATVDSYATYIKAGEDTDLATNGAFAADTDWTKGTGWTIAAGVAASSGAQTGDSDLEQDGSVVEGKAYLVTFTVSGYSTGNVTPVLGDVEGTDRGADGTHVETIVAGAGGVIALRADADFIGNVDNISVAPVAAVPGDNALGYASELIPAGREISRRVSAIAAISVVAAGTSIFTAAAWE